MNDHEPLRLPPERDLPASDAMLQRILADADRRRSRGGWPVVAAAAGVLTLALGGGVAWWLHQPRTQGPVPGASPSTSASWSASGQPLPARTLTPSSSTSASTGEQRFTGAGTATFTHFTVTVGAAPSQTVDGRWGRKVTVCVRALGPSPLPGNRTTVSWAPWSLTQGGVAGAAVPTHGYGPAYPIESHLAVGQCVTGMLTFHGAPAATAVLSYVNEYQESASWQLP